MCCSQRGGDEEWEKLARVRGRNNLDGKMNNCGAPTQNHPRCSEEFQIFSLWTPIYDQPRGGGSFPTAPGAAVVVLAA